MSNILYEIKEQKTSSSSNSFNYSVDHLEKIENKLKNIFNAIAIFLDVR